jgi:hypothetical protein
MKKALFPVLALVLVLCLSLASPLGLALAQENDPEVCLDSLGPGTVLSVSGEGDMWVGLFHLSVDGKLYDGWCIDPDMPIDEGLCFNAILFSLPRETPWCEIAYIMANYSPDSDDDEAAAIQLAIWKFVKGGKSSITTTDTGVENRACEIYDDAVGKCLTGSLWVLRIHPTEEYPEGGEIQETIILSGPSVGGDVRPVDKVAVLAPWIGLAVLLIAGGLVWLRLRRRSA